MRSKKRYYHAGLFYIRLFLTVYSVYKLGYTITALSSWASTEATQIEISKKKSSMSQLGTIDDSSKLSTYALSLDKKPVGLAGDPDTLLVIGIGRRIQAMSFTNDAREPHGPAWLFVYECWLLANKKRENGIELLVEELNLSQSSS